MGDIGQNIRRMRERADMSQEELAVKIGKTRSAVSQYESGRIIPRMGVIEDIADLFNVDKSEIVESRVEYSMIRAPRSEEETFLEKFRALDKTDQKLVMQLMDRLS